VTKSFGKLTAVNNVDIAIDRGELRGLIGPNGSGKTTLFNLITGFLRPNKGKIIWKGEDITRQPPHTRAEKGIVRTFQIVTLLNDMTVRQNVVLAQHLNLGINLFQQFVGTRRMRGKEKLIEQKSMEIIERLGLADLKDEMAVNLPHGHQEALALAIAMATEPELLLLDEPVTGMNPAEKVAMMKRIKKLNDNGTTILLVDHDMRTVLGTCQKLTVLNFGQVIAEGTSQEVSANQGVIEAYLGRGAQYA
jgi:branched-chain amino acid transport system ATP-binding protein